jgi:S1-C subfamily serine protease
MVDRIAPGARVSAGDASRLQRAIALGAALTALVLASVAFVVVLNRSDPPAPPAAVRAAVPAVVAPPAFEERSVASSDLLRLQTFDATEVAAAGGQKGLRIRDPELSRALGLHPDDILVAFGGQRIETQMSLQTALGLAAWGKNEALYVRLARGTLVQWTVPGGMQPPNVSWGTTLPSPQPSTQPSKLPVPSGTPSIDSALLATFREVDDTHVEVPRATVEAIYSDFDQLGGGARLVPSRQNGRYTGIKLYAIRPNSIYAAAGLKNGDTVRAINGADLVSVDVDQLSQQLQRLRTVDRWMIDITRRGRPIQLTITVR